MAKKTKAATRDVATPAAGLTDAAAKPAASSNRTKRAEAAANTTGREAAALPAPVDRASLRALVLEWLELEVPETPLIDGHAAPLDYLCHAFFEARAEEPMTKAEAASPPEASGPSRAAVAVQAEAPRRRPRDTAGDAVVWANRGGGKTFLGAVATVLDLVFKPGIEIRILGGSMEQSARMHAHLRAILSRPAVAGLVDGKITDRRVKLVNGSRVELLAQSQASVRGTRVQKLRCDEVELFDPDVWEAAQLTTRSKRCGDWFVRGVIECFSTMHIPHGLMQQLVQECATGRRRLFKWGVLDVLDACGPDHRCGQEGEGLADAGASTGAAGNPLPGSNADGPVIASSGEAAGHSGMGARYGMSTSTKRKDTTPRRKTATMIWTVMRKTALG